MFHVKHLINIINNSCILLKSIIKYTRAINIDGTRSESEGSSLNIIYLCALFLFGSDSVCMKNI